MLVHIESSVRVSVLAESVDVISTARDVGNSQCNVPPDCLWRWLDFWLLIRVLLVHPPTERQRPR
jgi:hypothetical protein